jgi:hypothetical protein
MAMYGEPPRERAKWEEFTGEFLSLGTAQRKQFEAYLKGIKDTETLDALSALPLLRRAATTPANRAADLYDAIRRLVPGYPKGLDADVLFSEGSHFFRSPKQIMQTYRDLLHRNFKYTRFDVDLEGTQPVVVIRCADMKEAAFVWASFGGLDVCAGCGKMFAPNPEKENQKYCSALCGQRIYQKDFRRRHPSKKLKKRR